MEFFSGGDKSFRIRREDTRHVLRFVVDSSARLLYPNIYILPPSEWKRLNF